MFVLAGWEKAPNGVTATTASGEIFLDDSYAAHVLLALCPSADAVKVQSVPLARIFAYLMVSVSDVANLADHARQPPLVYHNPSRVNVQHSGAVVPTGR